MYDIMIYNFAFEDIDLWPLQVRSNVKKPIKTVSYFADIFKTTNPIFTKFNTGMYDIMIYNFAFEDIDLWPLQVRSNVKKPIKTVSYFEDILKTTNQIFTKFNTGMPESMISNFAFEDIDLWPLQVRSNVEKHDNSSDFNKLLKSHETLSPIFIKLKTLILCFTIINMYLFDFPPNASKPYQKDV